MELTKNIQEIIAGYWLENDHFGGISSDRIQKKLRDSDIHVSEEEVKEILRELEKKDLISTREIESGDRISWVWNKDRFEELIEPGPHTDLWAYPKQILLEQYDKTRVEEVGIYLKQLKLGGSQIEHRFFERQVLERYREDPRYLFDERGSSGFISISDKFFLRARAVM